VPCFSAGEVFTNAARIDTAASPLRCSGCRGLSSVALYGRNVTWAIVLLAVGVITSYPSTISNGYFDGVSPDHMGYVRVDIWAIAVLASYLAFAFLSPLRRMAGDERAMPRRWKSLAVFVLLGAVLLYGYVLFVASRVP
jgi:hypothetical protein